MMYRTELVEGITVENVTEKINAKIEEMEKESYRLVTMSFWGTERAVGRREVVSNTSRSIPFENRKAATIL